MIWLFRIFRRRVEPVPHFEDVLADLQITRRRHDLVDAYRKGMEQ